MIRDSFRPTRLSAIAGALLAGTLLVPASVAAQDAHYWTYGYGPVGQLTEGVLVGGVSDVSATFYNPGALALLDNPRFALGLTSVELANVDIPSLAGADLDADQLVFDIVPSMVAGSIGGHGGSDRFAFAFLSRHDSDWDIGLSNTSVSANQPDGHAGFGRVRQRLVEYWVGGTWSHRLSDRLGVGISPFLAYRAQRRRRSLELESVAGGVASSAFAASEHEYNHVRALAKAGIAYRAGHWQLGLALTTPGVGLWSQGKVVFNASLPGTGVPLLSATTQKDLEAAYHSPWSVAGGATWRGKSTAIHSTVEWFSSVDAYGILTPEPAPVAGHAETIPLDYTGEARSVTSYGVGLEQRAGRRVVVYAGAAHNASAYVPRRDSFASWDLVDLTAGLTFDTGRSTLAFGAGYAWGSSTTDRAVAPPIESGASAVEARFSRWTFSFGLSR